MPLLAIERVSKRFGGLQALADVDLDIRAREIHALLGGNGAGKSTLIKILAGIERPDSGQVRIGDRTFSNLTPRDAEEAGLRFVHQDLGLVDNLSVAENIALAIGYELRSGFIDFAATHAAAKKRLARLTEAIPVEAMVGDLSQAEKVIVAVARALDEVARIVVLDEVTASLPTPEATRLHEALRQARAAGLAFIFVTHRIEEVFELCDRVSVLANGRHVATSDIAATEYDQVVGWIAGRKLQMHERTPAGLVPSTERLRLDKATGGEIAVPVSLSVRAGEVLGITGLIGSGYNQLAMWLAGIARPRSGLLFVAGIEMAFGAPEALRRAGLAVVPGNRVIGTFPRLSVRENLFPRRRIGSGMFGLGEGAERHRAEGIVGDNDVRPRDCAEANISMLSGGNQQKVVFLRAVEEKPAVLLLIDPTSGVDIGARQDLYRIVADLVSGGTAVILASSDVDEVAILSDRVLVLRNGAVGAELTGGAIATDRITVEAHRPSLAQKMEQTA